MNKSGTIWSKIACSIDLHDWEVELHGFQFEGNVYPLRIRYCKRCGTKEKEILDQSRQTAHWTKSEEE